jgi:hypothetical protein
MANPARPVTLTPIDTAWGLAVADSVVRVYPNAASRDADLGAFAAAELLGQVVVLTDTGALLVYAGPSMGWRPPWAMPWGRIADTSGMFAHTCDGSTPTVLSAAIAPAWPVGRKIRVSATVYAKDAAGTNTYGFTVTPGVTSAGRATAWMLGPQVLLQPQTPTVVVATTVPATLAYVTIQGIAAMVVDNYAGMPHLLAAEDIGPAVVPTALVDDGAGGVTVDASMLEGLEADQWAEALELAETPAPTLYPAELLEAGAGET